MLGEQVEGLVYARDLAALLRAGRGEGRWLLGSGRLMLTGYFWVELMVELGDNVYGNPLTVQGLVLESYSF